VVCPISFEDLSNITAEDAEEKKKRGELRSLLTIHFIEQTLTIHRPNIEKNKNDIILYSELHHQKLTLLIQDFLVYKQL